MNDVSIRPAAWGGKGCVFCRQTFPHPPQYHIRRGDYGPIEVVEVCDHCMTQMSEAAERARITDHGMTLARAVGLLRVAIDALPDREKTLRAKIAEFLEPKQEPVQEGARSLD